MTSTRNKNTIGDYTLEQNRIERNTMYLLDKAFTSPGHNSGDIYSPGNGLLPAKMNHSHFSYNGNDIESYLFGIGSTNLYQPADSHDSITIQEKRKQFLNITPFPKQLVFPEKLAVHLGQRPYLSNA